MSGAGASMDRIYRHQRHVYDLTRRYYLFGRDRLLRELQPPPGGRVLEIGCGTARNLLAAHDLYPTARLFGIDISREMLVARLAGPVPRAAPRRDRDRAAAPR